MIIPKQVPDAMSGQPPEEYEMTAELIFDILSEKCSKSHMKYLINKHIHKTLDDWEQCFDNIEFVDAFEIRIYLIDDIYTFVKFDCIHSDTKKYIADSIPNVLNYRIYNNQSLSDWHDEFIEIYDELVSRINFYNYTVD